MHENKLWQWVFTANVQLVQCTQWCRQLPDWLFRVSTLVMFQCVLFATDAAFSIHFQTDVIKSARKSRIPVIFIFLFFWINSKKLYYSIKFFFDIWNSIRVPFYMIRAKNVQLIFINWLFTEFIVISAKSAWFSKNAP